MLLMKWADWLEDQWIFKRNMQTALNLYSQQSTKAKKSSKGGQKVELP